MQSSNTIQLSEDLIIEDNSFENDNLDINTPPLRSKAHIETPSHQELSANESKGKTKLEISLTKLVRLIANVTESYTSAVFVADQRNKVLHSLAHHSLSRDYNDGVQIPYGRGLVGWTADNKVRITVCPFEHDARTLLYYSSDQSLKSFIAVPILNKDNELLGVIACDSKKSYAFAKITEKILTECAAQAELLITLHQSNQELSQNSPLPKAINQLETLIEDLRSATSEKNLFNTLCQMPQSVVSREAFTALVISDEGYGDACFYTSSKDTRIEHHLLDLVCKNKKVLSSERSVHVLPSDDIKARSFLSVPFHCSRQEAGALNILSAPFTSFSPKDIETLEKIAKTISRELERLRSKAIASSRQVGPSLLPWKHFVNKADSMIKSGQEKYSMMRLQFENLFQLECELGVDVCAEIHESLVRFIQQLAPNPMLASAPYGTSIFIFGEAESVNKALRRTKNLLTKIHTVDSLGFSASIPDSAGELLSDQLKADIWAVDKNINSINRFFNYKTNNHLKEVKLNNDSDAADKNTIIDEIHSEDKSVKNPTDDNSIEIKQTERTTPRQNRSIEEFILGESASAIKEKNNARFW